MRVSFDYGDTISRHPEHFRQWANAIIRDGGEVFMLTGVRFDAFGEPARDELAPRATWARTVDGHVKILWARGDNAPPEAGPTKAEYAVKHKIDLHVDNNKNVLNEISKATDGQTMTLHISGKPSGMFPKD